jgi:hypothetical protein
MSARSTVDPVASVEIDPLRLVGRVYLSERSELDSESWRSRQSVAQVAAAARSTPLFQAVVTGGIALTVGAIMVAVQA